MARLIITRDPAAAVAADRARFNDSQRAARRAAYETETDAMAFRVLRGEVSAEDYKARCDEIAARYPYQED